MTNKLALRNPPKVKWNIWFLKIMEYIHACFASPILNSKRYYLNKLFWFWNSSISSLVRLDSCLKDGLENSNHFGKWKSGVVLSCKSQSSPHYQTYWAPTKTQCSILRIPSFLKFNHISITSLAQMIIFSQYIKKPQNCNITPKADLL